MLSFVGEVLCWWHQHSTEPTQHNTKLVLCCVGSVLCWCFAALVRCLTQNQSCATIIDRLGRLLMLVTLGQSGLKVSDGRWIWNPHKHVPLPCLHLESPWSIRDNTCGPNLYTICNEARRSIRYISELIQARLPCDAHESQLDMNYIRFKISITSLKTPKSPRPRFELPHTAPHTDHSKKCIFSVYIGDLCNIATTYF